METKIGTRPGNNTGRGQNRILPADLSECLGQRALLHLCLDAVQQAPPAAMARARECQRQGRPEMFITLLTYCYSVGIYESAEIERAVHTDRTLRYICARARPDWLTLRRFRRHNRALLHDCLVHVMKQTWAFHFETGEADYAGYDWFESDLVNQLSETASTRLDLAALLDGADAD